MAGQRLRPTLDHSFRTPLTTILGFSEILKTELFGPLGSERYRRYAADISTCAAELQKFMLAREFAESASPSAQTSKIKASPAPFRGGVLAAISKPSPRRAKPSNISETAIRELIGCIYDTATEPDLWRGVVEQLALLLDAEFCSLLSYDRRKKSLVTLYMTKVNGSRDLQSPETLAAPNANLMDERIFLTPGSVWTDDTVVPPKMQHIEGHGRSAKSMARFRYRMTGLIDRNDAEVTFISALRSRQRGAFEGGKIWILELLLSHARKAMNVQRRVSEAERGREVLAASFGHLPFAAILVGSAGRPFYFNARARELFEAADGLTLGNEGLCGATVRETAALRKAIGSAVAAAALNSDSGGGALSLSRPSGRKPLSALVVPAPANATLGLRSKPASAAAIFVADPEEGHRVNSDTLRRFWHLTHNEARIAAMIAMGYGVERIAAEMEITANTVRTHLKHVYDKTQTAGQVELVHLIMSSPAALRQG